MLISSVSAIKEYQRHVKQHRIQLEDPGEWGVQQNWNWEFRSCATNYENGN
jgi:hypothetical protein